MKCYIVDDELHGIKVLQKYIYKCPELTLIGTSTDPIKGLQEISDAADIDLVFLDVDMPELSGLEISRILPKNIATIFTTAFSKYAFEAFEVSAVDFLLKPISFAKFVVAVEKVKDRQLSSTVEEYVQKAHSIFINPGVKGKVVQIHFNDIFYIEGLKNYVVIYNRTGAKHITYLTMNEIIAALPKSMFCRVHKSFVINLSLIVSIEGNQTLLVEQTRIPIGSTYKDAFMEVIAELTIKSNRK